MSPEAGRMLVEEIAPAIRKLIRTKRTSRFRTEDREEIEADCIAMAARKLHSMERHHKHMPPTLLAHFVFGNARSGQRFCGQGRFDVMAARTQLKGRSTLLSLGNRARSADGEEGMTIGDALVARGDDPACKAGRRIDWAEVIGGMDRVCIDILCCMVEMRALKEIERKYGRSRSWVHERKLQMTRHICSQWDKSAIEDAVKEPFWKKHVDVHREQAICRAERLYA